MPTITLDGRRYDRREGESVLDALLRQGDPPSFSCGQGVCLVCMLRRVDGEVPEAATAGIKARLRERGYVLACQTVPEGDVVLERPRPGDLFGRAAVVRKERLTEEVCRLVLEPATELYYHAGQFVNLRRPSDGLTRSYSLASVPRLDRHLELHVRRMPLGRMSGWIFDELTAGDSVDLQGPEGRCFYRGDRLDRPLLLIGTGTGVAPLWGVVRDALASGHRGPIDLYHGVRDPELLYLQRELEACAAEHSSFRYHPCVSGPVAGSARRGRAGELAFADHPELARAHVFLCGAPAMVRAGRLAAVAAGAQPEAVRCDPFVTAELDPKVTEEPNRYPPADPELWAALGEGKLLRQVLTAFYTQVYADPLLRPYFEHTTIDRSIGKQYSFLAKVLGGEDQYFGDRPRNAHHWMVISDAIFDHRAALMLRTLREHGVPEAMVRRFAALEESYRRYVVKEEPWPRIMNGATYPLEGYEELEMDVGTLCDACERAVEPGEVVRVHVRLGRTYCRDCAPAPLSPTSPPRHD